MANKNDKTPPPSKVATVSPDNSCHTRNSNGILPQSQQSPHPPTRSPQKKRSNRSCNNKTFRGHKSPGHKKQQQQQQQQQQPKSPASIKDASPVIGKDKVDEVPSRSSRRTPHPGAGFRTSVYSCCGVAFQMQSVYQNDPAAAATSGADLVVVYTAGLQECGLHFVGGFPEFVVWDVPACKVDQVCRVFQFLAHQLEDHRLVKGGEIVDSDHLILETKWITDVAMRARLMERFPFLSAGMHNLSCKWLALQPQFPMEEDDNNTRLVRSYPSGWGTHPLAPRGQNKLRDGIAEILLTKLVLAETPTTRRGGGGGGSSTTGGGGTTQSTSSHNLMWHVDGNPNNCSFANLQEVSLYEAFCHPTWYIDWHRVLNGDEAMVSYTKANMQHFANIFRPRSGKDFTVHDEAKIRFRYVSYHRPSYHHHHHNPVEHSPLYSPADSSVPNSNSNSNGDNTIMHGYLNIDSPKFHDVRPLSLPEMPPFGFEANNG